MPKNSNPWACALLDWHGYGKGGVRAPFRSGGRPTGETIRTPIIEHLDDLATRLVAGGAAPRWVFLVGGPGNGKSEAVEAFVNFLDRSLAAGGKLAGVASTKFNSESGVPRRVEIRGSDLGGTIGVAFDSHIGLLVLVQDASSMEVQGDAGQALVDDLRALASSEAPKGTTYLCCVNRGVLSDACRRAFAQGATSREFQFLKIIIEATAFRIGARTDSRPNCWPTNEPQIGCWPLDLESLFESGIAKTPAERLLEGATDLQRWEVQGACADCSSRELCPFRLNAEALRQIGPRNSLVRMVRRGELALGERVNFRAALSLVAETIVGDWSDFLGFRDPCEWVHEQVGLAKGPETGSRDGLRATILLNSRLTANAVFPDMGSNSSLDYIRNEAADKGCVKTSWLAAELARGSSAGGSAVREATFPRVIAPLDPSRWSPETAANPLRLVEDEFCQGVSEGLREFGGRLNSLEGRLLAWLEASEDEWAQLPVGDVVAARRLRRFLRGLASTFVKRSIGTREGHHLNETYLREYQDGLRSANLLNQIRQPLQQVLGVQNFRFGIMDSFGRALSSEGDAIALEAHAARLVLRAAPVTGFAAPAHDSPVLFVDDHGMALTFEVYLALRLQGAGCANSSLPPSVRASLDRVRHLRAGQACRNYSDLSGGTSRVHIGALGAIEAEPGSLLPVFNRAVS